MTAVDRWIEVCAVAEIDEEDVVRFDYGEISFAVYRSPEGDCYATDGFCTHERVHLANGLVLGHYIECPKHNGRFDYTTGEPVRKPACRALKTYPVKIENGAIYIRMQPQA